MRASEREVARFWAEIADWARESPFFEPPGRSHFVGWLYRRLSLLSFRRSSPRRLLKSDLWEEGVMRHQQILRSLKEEGEGFFVGVDVVESICRGAKQFCPWLGAVTACHPRLPFRDSSFDLILDLSTIDHLPPSELHTAISEYRRLLRRGGKLLLVVYAYDAFPLWKWVRRVRGIPPDPGQEEIDPSRVRPTLERCGFKVLWEGAHDLLRWAWDLFPWLDRVWGKVARWLWPLERSFLSRCFSPFAGLRVFWAEAR